MSREVRVAGIQFTRKFRDVDYNVDRAEKFVREAAADGAKIIALPELFSTGYIPGVIEDVDVDNVKQKSLFDLAESIPDGPTMQRMIKLAAELDIYLIAPIWEVDADFHTYYNTAAIIGPEGLLGRYRKRHIPSIPGMQERHYFTPGNISYPVFDSPYGKFGVVICFDRHYPEVYRLLTLKGAEMVFCVNNTPTAFGNRNWVPEIHVNAVANSIFIIQNNVVGKEDQITWFGASTIMSPKAEILAQLGSEEGIVAHTIDLDLIRKSREHYGSIRDTRWEDFGLSPDESGYYSATTGWRA
jgi:N-carbamoylputrescine amidase